MCTQRGIPVHEVYRLWTTRRMKDEVLAARPDWEGRDIDTIELYTGPNTPHTFPSLQELRSVLHEFFDEVSALTPSYSLGDRCPTLVLRP